MRHPPSRHVRGRATAGAQVRGNAPLPMASRNRSRLKPGVRPPAARCDRGRTRGLGAEAVASERPPWCSDNFGGRAPPSHQAFPARRQTMLMCPDATLHRPAKILPLVDRAVRFEEIGPKPQVQPSNLPLPDHMGHSPKPPLGQRARLRPEPLTSDPAKAHSSWAPSAMVVLPAIPHRPHSAGIPAARAAKRRRHARNVHLSDL